MGEVEKCPTCDGEEMEMQQDRDEAVISCLAWMATLYALVMFVGAL